MATRIANRARGNFLVAALLCTSAMMLPEHLDSRPTGDTEFSLTVGSAMDDYLANLGRLSRTRPDLPTEGWYRDLLRALAYARGGGIRRDDVWGGIGDSPGHGTV